MESLVVMDNRQVSVQELEVVLQGRAGGDGLLQPEQALLGFHCK